jgi:plasmid stabilization system protein ParE
MDCAVIYSEVALADLQQITEFIAADNAEVASRFANRLVDVAESLRSLRRSDQWQGETNSVFPLPPRSQQDL